jgi:hypothetical protein
MTEEEITSGPVELSESMVRQATKPSNGASLMNKDKP